MMVQPLDLLISAAYYTGVTLDIYQESPESFRIKYGKWEWISLSKSPEGLQSAAKDMIIAMMIQAGKEGRKIDA